MNIVDVVIILLVLLALLDGYRDGLAVTAGQYAGLLGGLLAGAVLAPHLIVWFDVTRDGARAIVGVVCVLGLAALGYQLGGIVAWPVRAAVSRFRITALADSVFGAVISSVFLLAGAWVVARAFDRGPNMRAAQLIQDSAVVRELDLLAPGPPAFLTQFERLLADQLGPDVFVGLEPQLPTKVGIDPSVAQNEAVRSAAAQVVKIEGGGCGGVLTGSGFPIAENQVMTNAHVVAGTSRTLVLTADGRSLRGQIVLFDPDSDLAVVQVNGLDATPLSFGEASRGTQGAAIGYPGGGAERVSAAVVDGSIQATGRDIFGEERVSRDVLVIEASIQPGNSGGPLVDASGRVVGVVFARSLNNAGQGFALSMKEIGPALDSLQGGEPVFDRARYRCTG